MVTILNKSCVMFPIIGKTTLCIMHVETRRKTFMAHTYRSLLLKKIDPSCRHHTHHFKWIHFLFYFSYFEKRSQWESEDGLQQPHEYIDLTDPFIVALHSLKWIMGYPQPGLTGRLTAEGGTPGPFFCPLPFDCKSCAKNKRVLEMYKAGSSEIGLPPWPAPIH